MLAENTNVSVMLRHCFKCLFWALIMKDEKWILCCNVKWRLQWLLVQGQLNIQDWEAAKKYSFEFIVRYARNCLLRAVKQ